MKKNINKLLLALAILCISHAASAQTESVEVVVSENKPAATVIINPAPAEAGDVSADADNVMMRELMKSKAIRLRLRKVGF